MIDLMTCHNAYTAVAVSILLRNYSNTEGTDLFVEVCVQIVFGTLSQTAFVDLWRVSQSATGEYIAINYDNDLYWGESETDEDTVHRLENETKLNYSHSA